MTPPAVPSNGAPTEVDWRALFEAAPGSYLVLAPDLTIVGVSDAYARATMTRREDIVGRGLFVVFPDNPEDPAADGVRNLRASLDRVREHRKTDVMAVQKYDIRRPDAEGGGFEERHWSPTNSPVLGAGGDLLYIIHRVEDVTEEVRRKSSLRDAEAETRRLNLFLDAIVENIPDMVFVKDARDLTFVRFNRAGEALLGVPRADLIGKNDHDFFPPEEASFFQEKDRETLRGKKLLDLQEPIDTRNGRRWLHTKKVPILDEHGEPRYLLGISEDITERREMEAALIRAKEEVEAANRELESFSYSVAHDLRAPLRSIDGFSKAILEDCGDQLAEESRTHLGFVRSSARNMALLIDDLLRLSRFTRAELARETVDVTAMARAAHERLARDQPDRRVELQVEEGLRAEADARLLAVVLENLLGNAWKFTSRREQAHVEIGAAESPHGRAFYVRDDGAGFDMAFVDKLFGAFQRLHAASDFEGTGIGLATVQRIVRRHGGRVWAEGAPGEGATFWFTLPAT